MFTYKILENNVIEIYDSSRGEDAPPSIIQPNWPNGDAWSSQEEAEQWASLYVTVSNNPDSELLPGLSPLAPTRPKALPVEEDTPAE